MKEYAQKIIDYLRIEIETNPGDSLSDLDEIAKIIHEAVHAAQQSVYLTAFGVGILAGLISFIIYLVVFLSQIGGR